MWPFRKKRRKSTAKEGPVWHEVGDSNPFDAPILDVRPVTLHMISTTKDPAIAENYTASRTDDGQRFIGSSPDNALSLRTNLRYPHNGSELHGVVFKSPRMEVKWDIYAYDGWFYFVRSWTSELIQKVSFSTSQDLLVLEEIEVDAAFGEVEGEQIAEQNTHSMLLTHALGRVWPYYIPNAMAAEDDDRIALYLFAQFGSMATIATRRNVLEIQLAQDSAG